MAVNTKAFKNISLHLWIFLFQGIVLSIGVAANAPHPPPRSCRMASRGRRFPLRTKQSCSPSDTKFWTHPFHPLVQAFQTAASTWHLPMCSFSWEPRKAGCLNTVWQPKWPANQAVGLPGRSTEQERLRSPLHARCRSGNHRSPQLCGSVHLYDLLFLRRL